MQPGRSIFRAKVYRLKGELEAASGLQHTAIEWMGEPAVAKSPENRLPWSEEYGGAQPAVLSTEKEKFCYAHLELSATFYLTGDEVHAKEQSDRAEKDCGAMAGLVKAVVRSELKDVAGQQGQLAGRAADYSRKFLD